MTKVSKSRARTPKKTTRKELRSSYPRHKRFFLHPVTAFCILCAGVLISGWTYNVVAATIITSVIEAPPLQDGAVITSPTSGLTTTTSSATVQGTCPANAYVKLYQNHAFAGSAWCDSSNTFSVAISLYSGANDLVARDFNVTDLKGPATPHVQVTYNAPAPPVVADTSPNPSPAAPSDNSGASSASTPVAISQSAQAAAKPPLVFTSDFHFQTFTTQSPFTWKVDLEGGTPPYHVAIAWGDGTSSKLYFPTDPVFTIKHTYTSSGYYAAVMTSVDKAGQKKVMQLAALITGTTGSNEFIGTTYNSAATKPVASNSKIPKSTQKLLFLAWSSYLIVVLMAVSFWLGEKRDYAQVKVKVRR